MCIIIVGKPEDITYKILYKAYQGNKDGFGLMYSDNKKNIITEKFLPKKFKEVLKSFKHHSKNTNQIALHFRFATQGDKNNFNCHPFTILNKKLGDQFDLFLMHNSPLLPSPKLDNKKSDTFFFSKYILRPILQNKNDLIFDESFLKSLNKIINCETSSRVLLLNSLNGEFNFLGDWVDFKNLKVSQTYSIQDYSKITYYPTSHSNFNFKNYAYDDDYYSDDYNTYYDSEKSLRKELLKKSLYKKQSKKNKNKKSNYKNDFYKYQNLSHIFDNGNSKQIFKLIKKLNHKQIADLITDLRDDKNLINDFTDDDEGIQYNDLTYKY